MTQDYSKIRQRFPNRVPVLLKQHAASHGAPPIHDKKYLCPKDLPLSGFQYILRQRLQIEPHVGIFLFV